SLLSSATIDKVRPLTGEDRVSVFVVDDSMFERNRSKVVELLSRFKDHATGRYYTRFRMLILGWSDGPTLVPVDYSLLAPLQSLVNGLMEVVTNRTSGYKRPMKALLPAPDVIPTSIGSAISVGVQASYVLLDRWFTYAQLMLSLVERGPD